MNIGEALVNLVRKTILVTIMVIILFYASSHPDEYNLVMGTTVGGLFMAYVFVNALLELIATLIK